VALRRIPTKIFLRRTLSAATLLACLAWAIPLLGITEITLQRRRIASTNTSGEAYHLPPARVIRALSLGHTELAADLLWLRTIMYFADHVTGDGDLTHLKRYLDTVVALDPHFKAIYRFGAAMLVSQGAHSTNDDVFAAIDLLERAHELYPEEPSFPLSIGTYYITALQPASVKQRDQWRRKGADWVRRAALVGADIPWLPSLAAQIYSQQGERQLAIRHLTEIYLVTQDPQMKAQIAAKLRHLKDERLDQLRQDGERLAAAQKHSRIAFMPPDVYLLIRQRPLQPFSIEPTASPAR